MDCTSTLLEWIISLADMVHSGKRTTGSYWYKQSASYKSNQSKQGAQTKINHTSRYAGFARLSYCRELFDARQLPVQRSDNSRSR